MFLMTSPRASTNNPTVHTRWRKYVVLVAYFAVLPLLIAWLLHALIGRRLNWPGGTEMGVAVATIWVGAFTAGNRVQRGIPRRKAWLQSLPLILAATALALIFIWLSHL